MAVDVGKRQRLDLADRTRADILNRPEREPVVDHVHDKRCHGRENDQNEDLPENPAEAGEIHETFSRDPVNAVAEKNRDIQLQYDRESCKQNAEE